MRQETETETSVTEKTRLAAGFGVKKEEMV